MNRTEILQQDLQRRIQDELEYQINIDNYRLAIAKIEAEHTGDSVMDLAIQEFSQTLQHHLQQSLIEQRKTIIMKEVIQEQLNAIS